ncbi:MAG TPA: hypothetical protein VK869_08245 [Rubrobacteraceae bacterium]|nr:hypothetical protein [Rubrobacteraceae bacterium]
MKHTMLAVSVVVVVTAVSYGVVLLAVLSAYRIRYGIVGKDELALLARSLAGIEEKGKLIVAR